jgi:hypothetical protein
MRIAAHWHVTPCNLVADYRRFGGTPCRHPTLQHLLRNVGNLSPDGAVSHSSRQHPHGVAEFQPTLVSEQSLEPDVSIVVCDNLTDVQPTVVVVVFSWRYNPLWLYFHSPVAGFSLLVFEVS